MTARGIAVRHGLAAVAILLGLLLFALPAAAQQEVITSFDSEIVVEADGSLTVAESITAIAAGVNIRRGIYRDFPTSYPGRFGLRETVGFELLGTWRDGKSEPHHIEHLSNGVRVYIGDPGRTVSPGPHTWQITYRTDRQLRFLDKVDELYWNVTGNGWVFPIEEAAAHIVLPPGAQPKAWQGYTGYAGEAGTDYRVDTDADGMPIFRTTRTLQPTEGLTIAVSWPKGFVPEPGSGDEMRRLFEANSGMLIGIAGLVLVVVYFVFMWLRVGRDPPKGVIFPRFEAPNGWSPVATGFVANDGFGVGFSASQAFAVALTSLGVKGVVTLDEDSSEIRVKQQSSRRQKLPPGEQAVLRNLFAQDSEVTLRGKYSPFVEKAVDQLRSVVKREYTDDYFRSNFTVWAPGGLIAFGAALVTLIRGASVEDDGFIAVFLLAFAVAFSAASITLFRNGWPDAVQALKGRGRMGTAIGKLVPSVIFAAPVVGVVAAMNQMVAFGAIVLALVLLATAALFSWLLRAPTMRGRAMLDGIEGYKLYLTVAEEDRLDMAAQEPEMTVARFEQHLPYAMALGVADAWTAKFESRIDLTKPGAGIEGGRYRPSWYHSSSSFASPSGLTGHIASSLTTTIASASTAPSSSSSGGSSFSSGGGSSGGGGGGGGGGGW